MGTSGLFLYLRWYGGGMHEKYLGGPLRISNAPILDCILANLHRLDVDELRRLQLIDKAWRPLL